MRAMRISLYIVMSAFVAVLLTACPIKDGYRAVRVAPQADFGEMTGAWVIPNDPGAALVLSKDGIVHRVDLGTGASSTFLDIRGRIIDNPGQEEGLLGLAFAPDYATSGRFYLYYSAGNPRRSVVSRFVARNGAGDPGSEQPLLQIAEPYDNHNGGSMAFGPDGMLYIGVGDGGSGGDPQGNGQNVNTLLGKILRIDVSGAAYAIPPDNPFARGGGAPEIWAWGFRNPWRFSFDRENGELWVGDVGQDAWEEVERVDRAGNYGWNRMEGSACYSPRSGCNPAGLIPPRATYGHDEGCSVTGGYVYRGNELPEMRGWFVYGDFCSGRVWAVHTSENASKPVQLMPDGPPVSSFMQDAAGELYLVSYSGGLFKLARK
jgi:glucose/arabinose dehydrogenase